MIYFITGLALTASAIKALEYECGRPQVPSKDTGRIIGGSDAVKGSWPWMALVGHRDYDSENYNFGCGASIINEKWIISAAHCFFDYSSAGVIMDMDTDPESYLIRVGLHDRRETSHTWVKDLKVKRVLVHQNYDPKLKSRDIALVELLKPIQFNAHVSPICLAEKNSHPTEATSCLVAGWGLTEGANGNSGANVLQQVDLSIVQNDLCTSPTYWNGLVKEDMLCAAAEGKGTCNGDSGGPLFCKQENDSYHLVGTIAFGVTGCRLIRPNVFMSIGYYSDWIQGTIAGTEVFPNTTPKPRQSNRPTYTTVTTARPTQPTTTQTSGAETGGNTFRSFCLISILSSCLINMLY